MKYVSFTLSMLGVRSWNGRWSGEGNSYVLVRRFCEKDTEKMNILLKNPYYGYAFSDGWYASVSVAEVSQKDARKLTKNSQGFCGYDWMVSSIMDKGRIEA